MVQEPLLPANSEYRKPRLTDAQKALMDAFIRLNYTMPRHRIKVKDICREAPAAPSTFTTTMWRCCSMTWKMPSFMRLSGAPTSW